MDDAQKKITARKLRAFFAAGNSSADRRLLAFFVLAVLAVSLFLTGLLSDYRDRLEAITEQETTRYLSEISSQTGEILRAQFHRSEMIVREMGLAVAERDYRTMEEVLRYMDSRIEGFGFGSAGLIDSRGFWHTPTGLQEYPQMASDFAHALLLPEAGVTSVRKVQGEPHLMVIVALDPFTVEGVEIQAISAAIPAEEVSNALSLSFFGGEGYANILSASGDDVYSSYAAPCCGQFNILEMLAQSGMDGGRIREIRDDMKSGEKGVFRFAHEGVENIAHYAPMGWQDWYLFIVVPSQVLLTRNAQLMEALLSAGISAGLLWAIASTLLLLFIVRKQSRMRQRAQAGTDSLRIQEELYKLALAHSPRHVLQLDVKNNTLRTEDGDFLDSQAGGSWSDLPEALLGNDTIAPESKDAVRGLYRDILAGSQGGELILTARNNEGRYAAHQVTYTTLFDDENKPSFAIITYEDISSVREKELAYKRWRDMLDKMPDRKYRLIEHNLTRDLVDNAEGELFDAGYVRKVMQYNQKMEHFVKELVHPEDVELFRPIMKREQLLRDYDLGKRSLEFDFRLLEKDSETRWVKLSMQLVEYPDSPDIKAYKMYEDIDADKRRELALKANSEQDSLTRVFNRGTFEEKADRVLCSGGDELSHAVILIDVDNLKAINDRYGHVVGDNTLVLIAGVLRSVFQPGDLIGRLGGDEFVVLMQAVPGDELVSRRVRQVNEALRRTASDDFMTSCSMGISMYPKDGTTFGQLYRRADQALYRAKRAGRDDFYFYSSHESGPEAGAEERSGDAAGEEVFDRCYLFRSEDEWRYRSILESTRSIVIEYDIEGYRYDYDISVSRYLAGTFDSRSLWTILLKDRVADSATVARMQQLVRKAASGSEQKTLTGDVLLRARDGSKRWFRMRAVKMDDSLHYARKVLILLNDAHEEVLTLEQLHRLADYDDLTDVFSKAAFLRFAAERIHRDRPGAYAVVALDVDRFKNVNELLGFEEGNRFLRHIAGVLTEVAGHSGMVGRLAGDQFVMLVPLEGQAIKKQLVPECLRQIDAYRPKMDVVINFGVYQAEETDLDVITMIDRAQAAQRTVKGGYRTRCAFYDSRIRKKAQREREIMSRMHQALAGGEFCVYLQPQYDHCTGRIVSAEALVRWNHPTRGLILPADFIPLFEESGFIWELDRHVCQKVCALLRRWKEEGLPLVPVSVNISRLDLFDPRFKEELEAILSAEGVHPSMLGLEITESAFVEDPAHLSEVLRKIRDAGFTLYMDDFGTGYSSLNILKDIPADVLKLDMRFLSPKQSNIARAYSILRAVIRMSGDLEVTTIAEGVETLQQADDLAEMGCNIVQGYFYSPPLPVEEYEKLLMQNRVQPGK